MCGIFHYICPDTMLDMSCKSCNKMHSSSSSVVCYRLHTAVAHVLIKNVACDRDTRDLRQLKCQSKADCKVFLCAALEPAVEIGIQSQIF